MIGVVSAGVTTIPGFVPTCPEQTVCTICEVCEPQIICEDDSNFFLYLLSFLAGLLIIRGFTLGKRFFDLKKLKVKRKKDYEKSNDPELTNLIKDTGLDEIKEEIKDLDQNGK